MLTPSELEAMPLEVEKLFRELENRVMFDVVRRLKNNGNEIIRSADWQIYRLTELGKSKEEIKKFIQNSLKLTDKEIDKIYDNVINSGYAHNSEIYKAVGASLIPYSENKEVQQLISAIKEQTNGEFKNITNSLGFATKGADGKLSFTPIAEYYQKTLDGAMLDIASGTFDYNTALKRIVTEMTNSGLRTVNYTSDWSNRVDVSARRAVMTGIAQLTGKINEQTAEELETDTYEVSWHMGARPSHQEWQGKWYTKEQLVSVCGLGTVTGLCGANCRHSYSTVIPGVSVPTYTDEQLKQMNEQENTPKDYYGKKYTAYEASQRQRHLETAMRAQRQKIKLLKDGGADEDDIIIARGRYRGLSQEYAQFSKAMDLPQQRERIYGDGLGDIGKGKWKVQTDSISKQREYKGSTWSKTGKKISKDEYDAWLDYLSKGGTTAEWEAKGKAEWKKQNLTKSSKSVAQTKTTSKLDECKTTEDVEKLLKAQNWFSPKSTQAATLEGADLESAKSVYKGYEKFFEKYPQMKGKFLPVRCENLSRGQAYAQASTFGGGVSVNKAWYSNFEKLSTAYAKSVKLGFHTKGTDYNSVVTHECGHGLDGYLTATLGKKKPISMEIRAKVLKATGKTILDIGEEVSIYATKDNYEFFGECLAEALWSESPRPVAVEFLKQLDEIMKEVK